MFEIPTLFHNGLLKNLVSFDEYFNPALNIPAYSNQPLTRDWLLKTAHALEAYSSPNALNELYLNHMINSHHANENHFLLPKVLHKLLPDDLTYLSWFLVMQEDTRHRYQVSISNNFLIHANQNNVYTTISFQAPTEMTIFGSWIIPDNAVTVDISNDDTLYVSSISLSRFHTAIRETFKPLIESLSDFEYPEAYTTIDYSNADHAFKFLYQVAAYHCNRVFNFSAKPSSDSHYERRSDLIIQHFRPLSYYDENLPTPSSIKTRVDRHLRIYLEIQGPVVPQIATRESLSTILNYTTDITKHLPYTIKGPHEGRTPLFGVELEVSSDYHPKDIIAAQKDLFLFIKQDGSVSGSKGRNYEMVTVPCSLKAHKRLWAEFFEGLDYTKFDTTLKTGNGMHIHITKADFTKAHLRSFVWFINNPANEQFILAISERPTMKDFNQWAARATTNNPGLFRNKYSAIKGTARICQDLRGATYIKEKTVELRIFKGIVSYATVVKNLEFAASLFEFTRMNFLKQITLKDYLDWLDAQSKNRFQTLREFLKTLDLKKLAIAATLFEHLWTEEEPAKVFQKMQKAPFTVTNEHVTALNRRFHKRIFELKHGKINLLFNPSGGKIAALDLQLQKKLIRGSSTFAMTPIAS